MSDSPKVILKTELNRLISLVDALTAQNRDLQEQIETLSDKLEAARLENAVLTAQVRCVHCLWWGNLPKEDRKMLSFSVPSDNLVPVVRCFCPEVCSIDKSSAMSATRRSARYWSGGTTQAVFATAPDFFCLHWTPLREKGDDDAG